MKDLLNKYLEQLNKLELHRAAALRMDRDDIARGIEDKIYCYSTFIHDLARLTDGLVISEVSTATFRGIENICYHKTNVLF